MLKGNCEKGPQGGLCTSERLKGQSEKGPKGLKDLKDSKDLKDLKSTLVCIEAAFKSQILRDFALS